MGFNPFKMVERGVRAGLEGVGLKKGKNPADVARPMLQEIPQYGREAYNPFIQQGQQAQEPLSKHYLEQLLNPQAIENRDIQGYEPSGYYNYMAPQLLQNQRQAAAAGGYPGTNEFDQMDLIRQMMGADIGDYLGRQNAQRQQGVAGLEGQVGRGFEGAGNLADFLGTAKLQQANNESSGAQQQNAQQGQNFGNIVKAIAQAYGMSQGNFGGQQQQQQMGAEAGGNPFSPYGRVPLSGVQPRLANRNFGGAGGGVGNYNPFRGGR